MYDERLTLEEVDRFAYKNGYNDGLLLGVKGKPETISSINVPEKFSNKDIIKEKYILEYQLAFSKGYNDGYNSYTRYLEKQGKANNMAMTEDRKKQI